MRSLPWHADRLPTCCDAACMQGPASQTKDMLIAPGSDSSQPQAWMLTSDALHSARPQSCAPHAVLLGDELRGLSTSGGDTQMQAGYCSCTHTIGASAREEWSLSMRACNVQAYALLLDRSSCTSGCAHATGCSRCSMCCAASAGRPLGSSAASAAAW